MRLGTLVFMSLLFSQSALSSPVSKPKKVAPAAETDALPSNSDLDDPAIWIHPSDSSLSLIVGADKGDKVESGGVVVYDLGGRILQRLSSPNTDNIDLRYRVKAADSRIDLVVANDRKNQTFIAFKVDGDSRRLVPIKVAKPNFKVEIYGLCLYQDVQDDVVYAVATGYNKNAELWRLDFTDDNRIEPFLAREFKINSINEGCVADDALGRLFVAEETKGIWQFDLKNPQDQGHLVAQVGKNNLKADLEGMALYQGKNNEGYLLLSVQGNSTFAVFDRLNLNYLGTFAIKGGNGIDGVTDTDGIEVTSSPLGSQYPTGLVVVHDDPNEGQNGPSFKLVHWSSIAKALNLNIAAGQAEFSDGT